jgi:hypothetical protein
MGGIQPSAVGQVVRIEGLQGDRFIADVMGAPFEFLDERLVALEADPSATANFAINGNFEAGRDGWTDFWSGGTPKPDVTIIQDAINAYSGNAVARFNLEGDDTHGVVWQQTVAFVNPGEVIQISWREKASAAGLPLETRLGANFGPTADSANFFGTGAYPIDVTSGVQVATTNYVLRRTSIVVPSGHNFVRFHIRASITPGQTAPAASKVFVDDFRMQRIILQGNPTDPVIFGGQTQFTGPTWAWDGIIFPTASNALKGVGWQNIMQSIRAQSATLMGGGVRTVTSTGIAWSQRLITISGGRASSSAPSGYFDIDMPSDGTVITGVAGATNKTVAGGIIPLGNWDALYYIPPYGSTSLFVPANLRVVNYTFDYVVPNEWICIAIRNQDTGMVNWFDGREQDYWRAPTLLNGWIDYDAGWHPAEYKRDNGIVYIQGLVKAGTIATTIFTLPAGYRPAPISNGLIFSGIVSATTSGGASTGTAHTHNIPVPSTRIDVLANGNVTLLNSLASNSYVSLSGVSFPAEA